MTPRFQTLIFDLDGTLADTLPLIYEAFDAALTPELGRHLEPSEIRAMFGPPDNQLIRGLVAADRQDDAIARYVETYERRHHDLVQLFEGMADLIADATAANMRLAVVTGKSRMTATMTLEMLGVSDRFPVLYAGDDVERQKPDPMALRLALEELAHEPGSSAAMIGDSAADVLAGKAAGISTIGVLWGSPDHDALLAAGPDIVCRTVGELREAVGLA